MKKITSILLISVIVTQIFNSSVTTLASVLNNTTTGIDVGCYWETVIEDVSLELLSPFTTDRTITKTKTSTYRNAKGAALWSVSITATFSYNGTTSKCISCNDNAVAYGETWSIKSSSCSKSDNSAMAYAVATHSNGKKSEDYSETVIIKCSKDGIIS